MNFYRIGLYCTLLLDTNLTERLIESARLCRRRAAR